MKKGSIYGNVTFEDKNGIMTVYHKESGAVGDYLYCFDFDGVYYENNWDVFQIKSPPQHPNPILKHHAKNAAITNMMNTPKYKEWSILRRMEEIDDGYS